MKVPILYLKFLGIYPPTSDEMLKLEYLYHKLFVNKSVDFKVRNVLNAVTDDLSLKKHLTF